MGIIIHNLLNIQKLVVICNFKVLTLPAIDVIFKKSLFVINNRGHFIRDTLEEAHHYSYAERNMSCNLCAYMHEGVSYESGIVSRGVWHPHQ